MAKPNAKELAAKLAKKRENSFVLGEVLTELMRVFGGSAEFAAKFHEQMLAAPAGGVARSRMMGDILRLITLHTQNLKGRDGSLGSMTQDELVEVLTEAMERRHAAEGRQAGGAAGDPADGAAAG